MSEAGPEGTLKGPFTREEASAVLGPHFVPIPRFGCVQGLKIRMIDDASLYLQNATVGRSFKLTLGGLDQLVDVDKVWPRAISDDRKVRIKYMDGGWHEGVLHEEWSIEEARKLLGCLLDPFRTLTSNWPADRKKPTRLLLQHLTNKNWRSAVLHNKEPPLWRDGGGLRVQQGCPPVGEDRRPLGQLGV